MPDYVPKALAKFKHCPPIRAQHALHPWKSPIYGQKVQYATKDLSTPLDEKGTKHVQAIACNFLYYARAVDPTILPSLNEISNKQSAPTTLTGNAYNQRLGYLHTNPKATIRYHASDMILCLVSDAAYLALPDARSRCATLFTLTNKLTTLPPNPTPNGPGHVMIKKN